jgi:hypothetical protein
MFPAELGLEVFEIMFLGENVLWGAVYWRRALERDGVCIRGRGFEVYDEFLLLELPIPCIRKA